MPNMSMRASEGPERGTFSTFSFLTMMSRSCERAEQTASPRPPAEQDSGQRANEQSAGSCSLFAEQTPHRSVIPDTSKLDSDDETVTNGHISVMCWWILSPLPLPRPHPNGSRNPPVLTHPYHHICLTASHPPITLT